MTFSLVARCADTGMFGIAISSSSPAVAARCSFARAGVGAVATQNVTDPALGPKRSPRHWKAFLPVNDQLVTVSLYGTRAEPGAAGSGSSLIRAAVQRIIDAN